jgi:pyruvate,water dikinase
VVFKPTLAQEYKPIIAKRLGAKQYTMVYSAKGENKTTENLETPREKKEKFCLSDEEVLELAKVACIIEDHYSTVRNKYTPMDMEWAKDGIDGKLYIVQARPETVHSRKDTTKVKNYVLQPTGNEKELVRGTSVGTKISSGIADVILSPKDMDKFKPGNILVTDMTGNDLYGFRSHFSRSQLGTDYEKIYCNCYKSVCLLCFSL